MEGHVMLENGEKPGGRIDGYAGYGALISLFCLTLLALPASKGLAAGQKTEVIQMAEAAVARMSISSPSFSRDGYIPEEFSCRGRDVNPPLVFEGAPEGAKSLALIMDDPDAPSGTWVHWVMWNIPPKTRRIEANSVPKGAVQGRNSWRKSGYGGPCPPSGVHHYFFKLYALDTVLSLDSGAGKAQLAAAMRGHILAQTEIIGLFKRK